MARTTRGKPRPTARRSGDALSKGRSRQEGRIDVGRIRSLDAPELPDASVDRRPSRRRLLPALLLATLLVLLGGGGLWMLRSQRPLTPATVPFWERSESPEEGRLLQAALARPGDVEAQVALAQQYEAASRPFETVWALQRAREALGEGPSDQWIALTLRMAEALEAAGLRARALELLAEGARRQPGDAAVTVRRAELQLRMGRPEAALQTLGPLRQNGALGEDGQRALGRALEAAGKDAEALAQYRQWAARSGSAEAHLRLGRLLVRLGQVAEGRAALERARRLAPERPDVPYALGLSYWERPTPDPDQAGKWLTEALRAAPGYAPANLLLGQMYLRHRRWEAAAEQFARVLARQPREPEALLGIASALDGLGHRGEAHERRGMAYVAQGKLPQALAEFRAFQKGAPEGRKGAMLVSQTLIQMDQNAAAAREVQAALARHPNDAELQERLAQLLILAHTRGRARQVCEAWRQAEPEAARPVWLLGRIAMSDLQIPQAVELFEQAARMAPQDAEIVFALGEALSRTGPRHHPSRALELLWRAVELAPEQPRYRYQLGLALQQAGRLEAARRQFLRSLDLEPTFTPAYTGLLQVCGRLREPGQSALFAPVVREQQEAKRVEPNLRRQVVRSPRDPAGYAALARYLAGRGDLKAARAQWEVVVALRPEDRAARQALERLERILRVL